MRADLDKVTSDLIGKQAELRSTQSRLEEARQQADAAADRAAALAADVRAAETKLHGLQHDIEKAKMEVSGGVALHLHMVR